MKHRRADWPDRLAGVAAEDLVFVDESGANTAMTRTHGYAPKGERLTASIPHGHYETITFVAALTMSGMTAPFAMDRAMNGPWFLAWIEQALLPLLRPGMVIVMDNLPAHKVAGVREAIAGAGCRVEYLPPYSPDLNPIENAFSKFKARLRQEGRRTVDGVYEAMRLAVDDISAQDCRGYFRHCGHRPATPP